MTGWLQLDGKAVLIAGAGAFGAAIAHACLEAGAEISVIDHDGDKLRKLQDSLGRAVHTGRFDVSARLECEAAVEAAARGMGRLDGMVHSVGVNRRVPIADISQDDWDTIIGVNAASCLWLGRCAAGVMRTAGGGRMVFISSVSGSLAHHAHGAYAASKGALNQLVRVMATEWAGVGIGVNAVAPGYALTPMTEAYCSSPGQMQHLLARIPAGRLAVPEDVASAALFLTSPRSSYITGHVLYVDGGRTLD